MWSFDLNESLAKVLLLCAFITVSMPAGAAVISGSVVEDSTNRPVARARVTIEGMQTSANKGPSTILTSSGGQFSFQSLPAGIYYLRVDKKGYATARYGQRWYKEPGTPIILEDTSLFIAPVRLRRPGVITGEVVDENQIGLPGVPVHAYSAGSRLKAIAMAQTDDRGVYRITNLEPGRYLVRTSAKQLENDYGLLPTYFGQTTSARDATNVEVILDQEVTGINIEPGPGRLATISGRVIGGGADSVILVTETGPLETRLQPGGSFRIGQVEPGSYSLLVNPIEGGQRAAYTELPVGNTDVNVTLEMQPAPRLRIQCESTTGAAVQSKAISIFLRRKEYGDTQNRILCGEWKIWSPGQWQMAVAVPTKFYVASIMDALGGEDIQEITLKPGESKEITVLLSSQPANLRGTVKTSDGQPAIGAPVFLDAYSNELRRRLGGIRSERTGPTG